MAASIHDARILKPKINLKLVVKKLIKREVTIDPTRLKALPDMHAPIAVFDLDGTLAHTAPDLIATLNVILEREGLPAVPLAEANGLIGAGAKALIERGFAVSNRALTLDRHNALFDDFIAHYGDNLAVHSQLFDGVEMALEQFRKEGWKLAVCTNKIEKHSIKLLETLGIAERFAAICGRDTFAVFKPDPDHLRLTIAKAGGDPGRAIMVGDSRTDIDTAKAAGIPSIGVPFGYTDVPMQELGADAMVHHFNHMFETAMRLDQSR